MSLPTLLFLIIHNSWPTAYVKLVSKLPRFFSKRSSVNSDSFNLFNTRAVLSKRLQTIVSFLAVSFLMPFKIYHLSDEVFLLLAIYYWLKPLLPTWQVFQAEGSCSTSHTCAEKGQDSSIETPLNSSMVNTEAKYPCHGLVLFEILFYTFLSYWPNRNCLILIPNVFGKEFIIYFYVLQNVFLRIYFAVLYCISHMVSKVYFSVFSILVQLMIFERFPLPHTSLQHATVNMLTENIIPA